jgi:ankyrin repeat protein
LQPHTSTQPGHRFLERALQKMASLVEVEGKEGGDINAFSSKCGQYTALMEKSIEGDVEAVKELLKVEGIDLNVVSGDRYTALKLAVNSDKPDVVKVLLADERCDALWTEKGGNALTEACVHGCFDCLELLLAVPGMGDLIMVEEYGRTAMTWCAGYGYEKSIKCIKLLQATKEQDMHHLVRWSQNYLHTAATSGEVNCIKLFLEAGLDPNLQDYYGNNCMMVAAMKQNKVDCVQAFLDAGVDPNVKNEEGYRALDLAGSAGHSAVEALLEPLTEVLPDFEGNINTFKELINYHVPVTVLMLACTEGLAKKVGRLLLDESIDVNLATSLTEDSTPYHKSIFKGEKNALMMAIESQKNTVDAFKLLLADERCNPFAVLNAEKGYSALRQCAISSRPDHFKLLLAHPAAASSEVADSINHVDEKGITIMTILATKGYHIHIRMINILMEHPLFNKEYLSPDGASYLMVAVGSMKSNCVKAFVDAGLDPNVRNTEGKNALDIARELNAQSIVDLLEPLTS